MPDTQHAPESQPEPTVEGLSFDEIFDTSITFAELGLRDSVLQGLEEVGFKHPTDIQAQLIKPILAGADVIGQAKTGTGKTAAFGLPLLNACDDDTPIQALILSPTRELAAQVAGEIETLGKHTAIRTTCIIGGESFNEQRGSLKAGGHIVVGTPGRVMDLHGRGDLPFHNVRFVVLDEVDRMLDIGFRDDIKKILGRVKGDHQTVFVSATIDEQIERLARTFMKPDAQKISVVQGSLTVSLVDQKHLFVEPWDKPQLLLHLLRHEEPDTTLVFCRTKHTVRKIAKYLTDKGVPAREIHGDLDQRRRTKVMEQMRQGELDVLIASDLAARGLDVEHITHVINYDLPEDPEVYIHRIGRTARAGRRGVAWTFVTPDQGQMLTEIEKLVGTIIEEKEYPDFTPGRLPDDVREQRERDADRRSRGPSTPGDRAAAPTVSTQDQDELAKMFPGGKVPSSAPARTLGSKFRTRRRK